MNVDPPRLKLYPEELLLENFPRVMLSEENGEKIIEMLRELGRENSRVLIQAGNGVGKTSRVAGAAILWHMMRFPGSLAVVTAGAYRQVVDALWPVLREKSNGLGGAAVGWRVTEDHLYLSYENWESRCIGYSVNDPNKAEGHHRQGRDNQLFYVIDEAKGVPDGVFEAMERCQPSRALVMSSPGAAEGMFWKYCSTPEKYGFRKFTITAEDCPHLGAAWIERQREMWGSHSPVFRSMVMAEFTEDEAELRVLKIEVMRAALASPPAKQRGRRAAGLDFAAGGDENVLVVRNGNFTEKRVCWRDKNTMAAVGRFLTEIKLAELKGEDCWADAGGLGYVMCDALREAGLTVNRCNVGEAAWDKEHFGNRGTEMWVKYSRRIEMGKIVPPDDEKTWRQMTARGLRYNSRGALMLETKEEMRARGLESPDRADAEVLAYCAAGELGSDAWLVKDNNAHEELDEILSERLGGANLAGCEVGY